MFGRRLLRFAVLSNASAVRSVRYRSLPADDPFGEKSSWRDPSDGVFSSVSGIDEDRFAAAAESDEVKEAHFGPDWSRFTTVGRLSIKKMKDAGGERTGVKSEPGSADADDLTAAERRHQEELDKKRDVMKHNYTSYEEFALNHLGAGEDGVDSDELSSTDLYTSAQMESEFVSKVENVYGRDRMAQRNAEREELETEEALSEGELAFPNFMKEQVEDPDVVPQAATPSLRKSDRTSTSLPDEFIFEALSRLGAHGIQAVPLVDPLDWTTDQIVAFLCTFERVLPGESTCMDESMKDAFFLAKVDGEMLLNTVTPPRLFRIMRRWHSVRKGAVMAQWDCRTRGVSCDETVSANIEKLNEVTKQIDDIIIKETILLCFPYAH